MIRNELRTIGFASVICVASSLLLSTTVAMLKGRQDDNVELARMMNVLKAFGQSVVDTEGMPIGKAEVDRIFEANIGEIFLDKETGFILEGMTSSELPKNERRAKTNDDRTILPLYLWKENEVTAKYAFPISGRGLWSMIYGYAAVDKTLTKFEGITFYDHKETPGMGAEIVKPWFQKQFVGKLFFTDGVLKKIEVRKEGADTENLHAVSGISAATMTGNGINIFLNRDLALYERYFRRIRRGNG